MRRRTTAASVGILVCLALVASVVVLALRADGREATETTTNDGGAWLVNQRAGSIGHLNREVAELSTAVRVSEPTTAFEVHQPEGAVVVHATTANTLEVVDERTEVRVNSVQLPDRAVVVKYDHGVIISTDSPFRIWRLPTEQALDVQSLDAIEPLWEGQRASFTSSAVGTVAVSGANETLTLLPTDGEQVEIELEEFGPVEEVLFDGEQPVVRSGGSLATVAAGEVRAIDTEVQSWQVSAIASVESTGSLVGVRPSGEVMRVALDTGEVTVLGLLGSDDPVPPIEHQGCVFAAGHSPPLYWVQCGDDEPTTTLLNTQPNLRLRLRLVNEWVWINDLTSGRIWVVSDALELSMVDDWGVVLPQSNDEVEPSDSSETDDNIVDDIENPDAADAQTIEADAFDDDGINEPPVAVDDEDYFTHEGRPLVVPVVANDDDPDNDVLLIETVSSLSGANATVEATVDGQGVQVTPAPGFLGTIEFSYRITDGRGGSDSASGSVTVRARTGIDNTPPVAVTDIGSITAGDKLIINVIDNDFDPDGDSVVLIDAVAPQGSLSFDPSGQIIYEPPTSSDEGEVELTYTIADDFGETAEGRVRASIRLEDSNQPPDARNDGAITVVGQPVTLNLLTNDTDPDGDELFVSQRPQIFSPAGADVFTTSTPDGEFVFIPESPGTFIFTYAVSDDQDTDVAQVRIEVTQQAANRPPVAVRDDVTVPFGESRIVYVLDNDGDPDGDIVGIVGLNVTAGSGLRVEPFLDIGYRVFVTEDGPPRRTFRYSISDGKADPVEATVVVAVSEPTGLNQPPLAQPDSVEVRPGSSVLVPVLDNDFDPEGGPLRVVEVSSPSGGSAAIGPANGSVRVGVNPDTETSFSVSYDVVDEQGNRTSSVIRVRVVPPLEPNRPPIARPDSARTPFETEISISAVANDSDPDGDAIRVESITAQPANGSAALDPVSGDVVYTPASGFSGTDRFSYIVVDALGAQTTGEVLVGVLPEPRQNRDPVANDDAFLAVGNGESSPLTVLINDSDPDGDQLRISSVGSPAIGSLDRSLDGRLLTFTAPAQQDTDANVEVSYTISDGNGGSDSATISIVVQATPPRPEGTPLAVDDAAGPVATGEPVRVNVVANDSDPDGPVGDLVVTTFAPEITVEGQVVVFAAPIESTQVAYEITDVDGNSATAVIAVEVFNPTPPVAVDDQFGPVRRDDVVDIDVLINDYDLDGEPGDLSITNVTGPGASIVDGQIRIEAPADTTEYTYEITDADDLTATGLLTLLVTENRAPTVTAGQVETEFETTVQIDLAPFASDPDGDPLLYSCCQTARNGSPSVLDAGEDVLFVDFTPDDGFSGDAVFSFEVDDQFGHRVAGSVTVTVAEQPNRAPTAVNGVLEIQAPRPDAPAVSADVDLAALTTDLDDDPLVWSLDSLEGSGLSGQVVDSVLRITATDSADAGTAVAFFTATDPEAASVQAAVEITVLEAQNTPPTAQDRTVDIAAGNTTTIDLSESSADTDVDDILTFAIDAPQSAGLTVTQTGDRQVTVVAAINAVGAEAAFGYTATDRMNEEAAATVSLRVVSSDQAAPVAIDDNATTLQGVAVDIPVLLNDSDPLGQGLTIVDGGATTDGSVATSGSTLTFDPNPAFFGTTDFIYTIGDATQDVSRQTTAVVTVEVTGRPAIPPAPTCEADSRLANLTWTEPENNGAPITGYLIEHDQLGSDTLGPSTSFQWSGLDNGTEYRFRVAAENVAGTSVFSQWSVACRPNIEPERPAPPQVTHGDEYLDLTWTEPANDGTEITEYEIRLGGGIVRTATDTSLRWTDLTNGDSYTFEIAARNDAGLSEFSTASAPEKPSTTPAAPVIGATTRAGLIGANASGILQVNWTPVPVNDDGGDTVIEYRVERENGGSVIVNGANANSYEWSGLPNGETNRFRVIAINRDGDSQPSAWSVAAQACTVPGSPTAISAAPGDGQATVTFSAPTNDGGCNVTDYDLRIADTTGTGSSHTTVGTKTVGGLDNGTTYSFEIRANNVIGSSAWVETNSVVPAGLPKCGGGPDLTSLGHNWAALSWGAANFNGTAPLAYEASINNGAWNPISNDQSGSVTLTPDTNNTVRIRARNLLGVSPSCGFETFDTCPAQPPAPAAPTISANQNTDIISTSWNTVTIDCTNQPEVTADYDIARYEIDPDPGAVTDEGLSTSKSYGPLNPGDELRTRVRACYATGCGAWSPWSPTEQIDPLGTVSIEVGTPGSYPADECWNAASIIASGGNPSQGCYDIRIDMQGWSGTHTVRCFSTMNDGFWDEFASFTAGNGIHNECSYSAAGRWVVVVIDGTVQDQGNGNNTVSPPAVASNVFGQWPTN